MIPDNKQLWIKGADIPLTTALANAFGAIMNQAMESSEPGQAPVNECLNALALATAALVAGTDSSSDRAEKLFLSVYQKNKESMTRLRIKQFPYPNERTNEN